MQRQTPIRRKIATETEPPMVQQAQVVSAPLKNGLPFMIQQHFDLSYT